MARRKRKRDEREEMFLGEDARPPEPGRLTPVDVQQKVFRLAFRGYRESDVDEFLDQVTETLAALHEENKRLRESVDAGTGGAPATQAAERQAADIVRQAREHAARLVEEAEARTGAQGSAPPPASFLVRERAFLQELATLVQSHARSLKEAARRPKEPSGEPPTPPAPAAEERPASVGPRTAAGEVTVIPDDRRGEAATPPQEADEEGGSGVSMGPLGPAAGTAPPITRAPETSEERAPAPPHPGQPTTPARAFAPEDVPGRQEQEAPTVPWRPSESESPAEAGWSVEGSGEEGDPLLSAWESAFLARPEDEDRPPEATGAEATGEGPPEPDSREGGLEPHDRDSQEPSLRELFWGEE